MLRQVRLAVSVIPPYVFVAPSGSMTTTHCPASAPFSLFTSEYALTSLPSESCVATQFHAMSAGFASFGIPPGGSFGAPNS
jgi:hypothetical protein